MAYPGSPGQRGPNPHNPGLEAWPSTPSPLGMKAAAPPGPGESRPRAVGSPLPCSLPLAVWRSTSTVGFPRESRISRAQIFSIDMMAEMLGGREGRRKIRGLERRSLISGRGYRLGAMGKRLLQWVGVGEEVAAVLALEGIPPHPTGREGQCSEEGEVTAVGGRGGSNGEKGGHRSEEGGAPAEVASPPLSSSDSRLVGFPQISECNGSGLHFSLEPRRGWAVWAAGASPPEPPSHANLTPQPPLQGPSSSPKHTSLLFPRDVQ